MKKILNAVTGVVETGCSTINNTLKVVDVLSSAGLIYAKDIEREAQVDYDENEIRSSLRLDLARAAVAKQRRELLEDD